MHMCVLGYFPTYQDVLELELKVRISGCCHSALSVAVDTEDLGNGQCRY
jgi:hypothetical protein